MGAGLTLLSCPLLAALLAPAAAAAMTPGPHWVQATPSGGSIVALERAPSSSLTLYALTDNGDLFQTTDGAVTWSHRESRRFNAAISGLGVDRKRARERLLVARPLAGTAGCELRFPRDEATVADALELARLESRCYACLRFQVTVVNDGGGEKACPSGRHTRCG